MYGLEVRTTARGALVEGRAPAHVRRAVDDIEHEVARYGKDQVQQRLDVVLKTQTPYYRTRIAVTRAGGDWEVTDQGVVYGPWLEGVGSRNSPVTRFKGYATFRRVAGQVEGNADRIAERVLRPYLRDL